MCRQFRVSPFVGRHRVHTSSQHEAGDFVEWVWTRPLAIRNFLADARSYESSFHRPNALARHRDSGVVPLGSLPLLPKGFSQSSGAAVSDLHDGDVGLDPCPVIFIAGGFFLGAAESKLRTGRPVDVDSPGDCKCFSVEPNGLYVKNEKWVVDWSVHRLSFSLGSLRDAVSRWAFFRYASHVPPLERLSVAALSAALKP